MRRTISVLVLVAALVPAEAKTLRWSSANDHASADPHGQNQLLNNVLNSHVYENLVNFGKKLELVPWLATSWKRTSPTTWVFSLRKGVKFHDGSELTADDVVFSIKRAQGQTSTFRVYAMSVGEPRRIDAHTVELTTAVPNPVLLEQMALLRIMSRAWSEKHGVEKSQDFAAKTETYASRNAMGTGPFTLVSRAPDVNSVFRKNPNWWGLKEGLFEGNVDEIVYSTVKSDATRMSALVAGDLDFVLDPPIQDVERLKGDKRIRIWEGPENLTFFLGMDQARDELVWSDVKGRNPFKDRRVRLAFYQAIDDKAINRMVMRGSAVSIAILLPNPEKAGIPKELDKRYPYDLASARRLMAEAGYPDGFTVTLDCQNVRDKVCTAVAGMLAQIKVKVKVNLLANAQYFAKGSKLDSSFYLLGWGGPLSDAIFTLQPVLHSRGESGDGFYNWGNYRDAGFDALIDRARVELDPAKRQSLIVEAMKMHHDNIFHIPLHRRMAPWASRSNVEVVHRSDTNLQAIWVKIK